MAAVHHLGFVMRKFGPLMKGICGFYHCVKFGWNLCGTLHNMQVLIFSDLGFKMPCIFTLPKLFFLGEEGKIGERVVQF